MKRFFRIFFIGGTIVLAVIYLIACLTPFFSAAHWVVMGYLGLGFPFLLVAMLLSIAIWFFFSKKIALLLLAITAMGSYHINHLWGWNQTAPFNRAKISGTLRIMGWNVQNFSDTNYYKSPDASRFRVMRYVQQQQPDIICFQDFSVLTDSSTISNISIFTDSLHYPFFYYSNTYQDLKPWNFSSTGVAIFSKYPLQHLRRILYSGKRWPEAILQADVTINGITRRIITTHLQSMWLKDQRPEEKMIWQRDEDSAINYSGSIFKKLNFYFPYHARQAKEVRQVIDASPYPVIFSADMNEVSSSYCYSKIRGNLNDAFLQKGNGLGRTYYRLSPTLRIDYLFTSPGIEIVQYQKDTPALSDHYPQLIDIKW